mmetsp:Transcript_3061/g.9991  ORF Transcript_3061/g.9991 Transcript_3061/m.9991 type:complete len:259 (-) Transcript_3061:129-905(-)
MRTTRSPSAAPTQRSRRSGAPQASQTTRSELPLCQRRGQRRHPRLPRLPGKRSRSRSAASSARSSRPSRWPSCARCSRAPVLRSQGRRWSRRSCSAVQRRLPSPDSSCSIPSPPQPRHAQLRRPRLPLLRRQRRPRPSKRRRRLRRRRRQRRRRQPDSRPRKASQRYSPHRWSARGPHLLLPPRRPLAQRRRGPAATLTASRASKGQRQGALCNRPVATARARCAPRAPPRPARAREARQRRRSAASRGASLPPDRLG